MRKLHPVGAQEVPQGEGMLRRPDGQLEHWTRHALPDGRRVIRVEVTPAAPSDLGAGELWHLMLDAGHLPERLEFRLREGSAMLESTCTFFADEVLVWRRGAGPSSEAVAVPPGYRLLWPPFAGRNICLAGLAPGGGPDAVMCFSMRRRPAAAGWLRLRPVKFTVRSAPGLLTLTTPGLADQRAELDADGETVRWHSGNAVTERAG